MSEQLPFRRRRKGGAGSKLGRSSDVVQDRRAEKKIDTKSWMQLCNLPADRCHADRVLEQAACVAVMSVRRCRQQSQRASERGVVEKPSDDSL